MTNLDHITVSGDAVSIKVFSIEGQPLHSPATANGTVEHAVNLKRLPFSYGMNHGSYNLSAEEVSYIKYKSLQMFDRSNLKGLNEITQAEIIHRFNSFESMLKLLKTCANNFHTIADQKANEGNQFEATTYFNLLTELQEEISKATK